MTTTTFELLLLAVLLVAVVLLHRRLRLLENYVTAGKTEREWAELQHKSGRLAQLKADRAAGIQ